MHYKNSTFSTDNCDFMSSVILFVATAKKGCIRDLKRRMSCLKGLYDRSDCSVCVTAIQHMISCIKLRAQMDCGTVYGVMIIHNAEVCSPPDCLDLSASSAC